MSMLSIVLWVVIGGQGALLASRLATKDGRIAAARLLGSPRARLRALLGRPPVPLELEEPKPPPPSMPLAESKRIQKTVRTALKSYGAMGGTNRISLGDDA